MKIDMTEVKAGPHRILDMDWGYARSRTLATGIELDVFTQIANGKHTSEEIAQATKSSLRGMRMLLNALVSLELLTKDSNDSYDLAPDSREFLVRGKPGFLGGMSVHAAKLSETWGHLTESVKTGKPYTTVDEKGEAEDFFPDLVKALFSMNYQAAKFAASYLKSKNKKISNILDVAAGSGVWGIAFAQEFQAAKLTAIDFPSVCNITHEYVKNFGVSDRFECIEGDIREADFGKEGYDLIILGHICHSEGRRGTEKLLKKSCDALRAGGYLLIAEFLPNDDRTAPPIPLLFALNMLVNTNEGDVFTIGEFRKWLTGNGFGKIEVLGKAPSISPLIMAAK